MRHGPEHVTLGPALWVSRSVTEVTSISMISEVQFVADVPRKVSRNVSAGPVFKWEWQPAPGE